MPFNYALNLIFSVIRSSTMTKHMLAMLKVQNKYTLVVSVTYKHASVTSVT